jgi:fibronectin type III domain protein
MNAYRIHLVCLSLLAALCTSCDSPDPLEPIPGPTAFAAGGGGKVNAPSNPKTVTISHSQIDVSWQDNASNETGFEVHRLAGAAFGLVGSTGAGVINYSDTGLIPSTEYCYKVRAVTVVGRKTSYSAFSSVACATTAGFTPIPLPKAPSETRANPINSSSVAVTWVDNADNEDGFRVERTVGNCWALPPLPWELAGTTGPNIVSFTDAGREPDVMLCYRVVAFNAGGTATSYPEAYTFPPKAPTNLAATKIDHRTISITWTDNSGVEDLYQVQRATAEAGPYAYVTYVGSNVTVYRDAGLEGSTTYWYRVRANKNWGFSDFSNPASATTDPTPPPAPPDAPSSINVTPSASTWVTITWADKSWNEDGFRLERSVNGGTSWTAARSTGPDATDSYDSELSSEQQVCYRVIAFNAVGDGIPSETDCTTPPAAPTGLTAAGVDWTTVDLAWTDNSSVEDGYEVWLSSTCQMDPEQLIASLPANSTAYRFTDVGGYCTVLGYYVRAAKDGGASDPSNMASAP